MASDSNKRSASKKSRKPIFGDSDSESDDGAQLEPSVFKVNQEFAQRFEHNKKREERHKLEEIFKKDSRRYTEGEEDANGNESSSDETEDEDGFLATEDLDAQISATLHAIRTKNPRVYDKNVTFVQLPDDQESPTAIKKKATKPLFLRDYQRERILRGDIDDDETEAPMTYMQEQDTLKKSILSEMHASLPEDDSDGSENDAFMKIKTPEKADANGIHISRATKLNLSQLDVVNADKNPDTFLSNYMASRAWIPEEGGKWQAFESDEGDDDRVDDAAEKWEEAYNMRFEHPTKSEEFLTSYARDFAAARSVRREEKTGRKRQRELEREKKAEEDRMRREERARLRKLKLEEVEEKLRKVREAAGTIGKEVQDEDWIQFLEDAWDNDRWEEEMRKRFGDEYYALDDDAAKSGDDAPDRDGKKKSKKGPQKPKWHDKIDIQDIVPDFVEDDEARPPIALSEEEDAAASRDDDKTEAEDRPSKKRKTSDRKRARLESQRTARYERSRLEALVDKQLALSTHALPVSAAGADTQARFRYRATSPQAFGMTAREILLAPSDQALNAFAGLKKLAPFRDADKKRRDRKRLGKKARLREWRRDTFGIQFERDGPTFGFERLLGDDHHHHSSAADAEPRDLTADLANKAQPLPGAAARDRPDGGGMRKKRKRSKGKAMVATEAPSSRS